MNVPFLFSRVRSIQLFILIDIWSIINMHQHFPLQINKDEIEFVNQDVDGNQTGSDTIPPYFFVCVWLYAKM